MKFRLVAFLAALHICGVSLMHGQEIGALTTAHTVVPDDAPPDAWRLTQFAPLTIGSELEHTFIIRNFSSDTTLTLFQPTVGGPDAAHFSVTPVITPVAPGTGVLMGISFKPTSVGVKTATVTLNSDDEAPEDVYTFNVTGEGVADPVTQPDLVISIVGEPKAKYLKKEDTTRIKAKVEIQNVGNADMASGVLQIYESHTDHLDSFSVLRGTVSLDKAIPAMEPGKNPKKRKVRVDVTSPFTISGKLFVRVFPLAVEADFADNQAWSDYPAPVAP